MNTNGIERASLSRFDDRNADQAFGVVREAIRGVQFGSVTVIIQDGRIVQVDRTEKLRVAHSKLNGQPAQASS